MPQYFYNQYSGAYYKLVDGVVSGATPQEFEAVKAANQGWPHDYSKGNAATGSYTPESIKAEYGLSSTPQKFEQQDGQSWYSIPQGFDTSGLQDQQQINIGGSFYTYHKTQNLLKPAAVNSATQGAQSTMQNLLPTAQPMSTQTTSSMAPPTQTPPQSVAPAPTATTSSAPITPLPTSSTGTTSAAPTTQQFTPPPAPTQTALPTAPKLTPLPSATPMNTPTPQSPTAAPLPTAPTPTALPNAPQLAPIPPNTYTSPDVSPYFQQYQALLKMSPQEEESQTQLNQLNASRNQSMVDLEGQPIAIPFITGQQAAVNKQFELSKLPLQNQLALAQGKRQGELTAAGAQLDFVKYQADAALQQRKQQLDELLASNSITQQQYQNELQKAQLENEQKQQEFENQFSTAQYQNTVGQQGFQNQMETARFQADQQYNNQKLALDTALANNQISQQTYQNELAKAQLQNQQAQQQYENQFAEQQFNAQQSQRAIDNQTEQQRLAQQQSQFQASLDVTKNTNATKSPGLTEVSPGATLYNTSTSQPVYTAPTAAQQSSSNYVPDAQVLANQAAAAKLGVSIPGLSTTSSQPTTAPKTTTSAPATSYPTFEQYLATAQQAAGQSFAPSTVEALRKQWEAGKPVSGTSPAGTTNWNF